MLELKNIHKSFGEREILSGISLKLEKGNVYTLMGANGTGKTTLFNIVTSFLKADEGEVLLNGKKINNLSPVVINSLGITRTFQNLRLIEGLTVLVRLMGSLILLLKTPQQRTKGQVCRWLIWKDV